MIGSASAHQLMDDRQRRYNQPFLATLRAIAACTREFARLSDEVREGLSLLAAGGLDEKAAVRQSPERCIVQLGPVALTIAWLQGAHDSVATGELLVIVWRGVVAPVTRFEPERPTKGPTPGGATAIWEQVLTAVADSETTWVWQPNGMDAGWCSSKELAARCVDRLRVAYLEYAAA